MSDERKGGTVSEEGEKKLRKKESKRTKKMPATAKERKGRKSGVDEVLASFLLKGHAYH